MRTVVLVTCPTCGDQTLDPAVVALWLDPADGLVACRLPCPRCQTVLVRMVGGDIVGRLMAVGVTLELWIPPAELAEEHVGPPIRWDDLLDLHLALEDDA